MKSVFFVIIFACLFSSMQAQNSPQVERSPKSQASVSRKLQSEHLYSNAERTDAFWRDQAGFRYRVWKDETSEPFYVGINQDGSSQRYYFLTSGPFAADSVIWNGKVVWSKTYTAQMSRQ